MVHDSFVTVASGAKRLDSIFNRRSDLLESLQFGELRGGLLEDEDVGIGIFPESEESGVGGAGFGWVTGIGVLSWAFTERSTRPDSPPGGMDVTMASITGGP